MIIIGYNGASIIDLKDFYLEIIKINDEYKIVARSLQNSYQITLFTGTEDECKENIKRIYNSIDDKKFSFDKSLEEKEELNNIKKKINKLNNDFIAYSAMGSGKECPDCGSKLDYADNGVTYASNPPKYLYICRNCGKEFIL